MVVNASLGVPCLNLAIARLLPAAKTLPFGAQSPLSWWVRFFHDCPGNLIHSWQAWRNVQIYKPLQYSLGGEVGILTLLLTWFHPLLAQRQAIVIAKCNIWGLASGTGYSRDQFEVVWSIVKAWQVVWINPAAAIRNS